MRLLLVTIIAVNLVACGNDSAFDATPTSVTQQPPVETTRATSLAEGPSNAGPHAIGEAVRVGDFAVTITEVSRVDGTRFRHPDKGDRFLIVSITIENQGIEIKDTSPIFGIDLGDSSGQSYMLDFVALTEADGKSRDASPIAPDEQLRAEVGFIGSNGENAEGKLVLTFSPGPLGVQPPAVFELAQP